MKKSIPSLIQTAKVSPSEQRSGSQKQLSLRSPMTTAVSNKDRPLPTIPDSKENDDPARTSPRYVPPGIEVPLIDSNGKYTSAVTDNIGL